jgi:hypothetical protein
MVEAEERDPTPEEIRAKIAEAKRKKEAANFKPRDPKTRRAAEQQQRKDRVNPALLRGQCPKRDETWTIRARPDLVKQVKQLATELSAPGAKVSFAALMQEAMEMLLAHYRAKAEEMLQ